MKPSLRTRKAPSVDPSLEYPEYIRNLFPTDGKTNSFTYKPMSVVGQSKGKVYKEILDNYDYKKYPFQTRKSDEKGGDGATYDPTERVTGKTKPFLELPDEIDPASLAHELMHSEDHRGHNAYKNIWKHIQDYATKNKIDTWADLNNQLGPVQDKIDPTKAFKNNYFLQGEYNKKPERGTSLGAETRHALDDTSLMNENITPEAWNRITKTLDKNHYNFPLNYASEYPSFMMERITEPWGTGNNIKKSEKSDEVISPALTLDQADLLRSMLGSMRNAYPQQKYPIMNKFITERRRSIERTPTWQNSGRSASPSLGQQDRLQSPGNQTSSYGGNQPRVMDSSSQLRLGGNSPLQQSITPYSPPQLQSGSPKGMYGNRPSIMGMQSRASYQFGERGEANLGKRSQLRPDFSGYISPKTESFSGANPLLGIAISGDTMLDRFRQQGGPFTITRPANPIAGMMNSRGSQGSNYNQSRGRAPSRNRPGVFK